jgi:hypothetical protein
MFSYYIAMAIVGRSYCVVCMCLCCGIRPFALRCVYASVSDGRRVLCGIRSFVLRCVYVYMYFGKFGPRRPNLGPITRPSWDRNYIEYGNRFICARLLRYDVALQHMNVCSVQYQSYNHVWDFPNANIQHITCMRVRHSMFLELRVRSCVLWIF